MNENDISDLRTNLDKKTTDELLNIWTQNDRQTWRVEAFEAVRQILADRGVDVPSQHEHIPFGQSEPQIVVVKDIHMQFGSMVVFMVKWAIAAIPAIIILWVSGLLLKAVFGGFLFGFPR